MTKAQIEFAFNHYQEYVARCQFLRGQIARFEKVLAEMEANIAEDEVSITAQYTDMPHGSGTSDPTGSIGLRLASGDVPKRIKDLQRTVDRLRTEYTRKLPHVSAVDACLLGMSEREQFVVRKKLIEGAYWREVEADFTVRFGEPYGKSALKSLLDSAMAKAYRIAK